MLKNVVKRSKISFNQPLPLLRLNKATKDTARLQQAQSAIALATAGKFRTSAEEIFYKVSGMKKFKS